MTEPHPGAAVEVARFARYRNDRLEDRFGGGLALACCKRVPGQNERSTTRVHDRLAVRTGIRDPKLIAV